MKTFISALIILALLISLVTLCSLNALGRIDRLAELALSLPETDISAADTKEKTQDLCDEWQKNADFFLYFVSRDTVLTANEAALALRAASLSECREDFASARLRFISAMERIRLLFTVSAESIL